MKLQPLLSEYLFSNGNLPLPGIGYLQIQQMAAKENEAGTQLMGPVATIVFKQNKSEEADQKLKDFISNSLKISGEQAQSLLKENDLQRCVAITGETYSWPAVGTFHQSENNTLSFQPDPLLQQYFPPVSLISISPSSLPQPKPDVEQSEVVANELLEETPVVIETSSEEIVQSNRWWIGAIIIFILSLLLIAYRYL